MDLLHFKWSLEACILEKSVMVILVLRYLGKPLGEEISMEKPVLSRTKGALDLLPGHGTCLYMRLPTGPAGLEQDTSKGGFPVLEAPSGEIAKWADSHSPYP